MEKRVQAPKVSRRSNCIWQAGLNDYRQWEEATSMDGRIDDLIEAWRGVLDSDFDPVPFKTRDKRFSIASP